MAVDIAIQYSDDRLCTMTVSRLAGEVIDRVVGHRYARQPYRSMLRGNRMRTTRQSG